MWENAFIGHTAAPTDPELAAALGPAFDLWNKTLEVIRAVPKITATEWTSYSPKAGWALRAKAGKRNIIYLTPCATTILATFIFGDRALAAIRATKFPKRLLKVLDEAPRYPEGTGVRLPVKTASDVALLDKLIGIKLAY